MDATLPAAPLNKSRALPLARLHGAFNVAGGLWPVVHMRSFEAVLGPKVDRWLVYTVAGLMACIGATQLSATGETASLRLGRRIGIGSALTLGTIDVLYSPRGRISKMYLVDALAEAGWLIAWATTALDGRQ
ncbi:hypothetical protein [Mycobacterium sp. 852002-40037_SCH5390672]|uniref:hypothetical protein n=1 Tax=Mycobacterium sp. 852002-40037_SCH5390672 TaxID=1834089 RepID=UPI0008057FFF|nr:hypothetical protein [Mycobacterium sp. 852002-40037_SCH5390672]OBB95290.1 hypothetical protein A5782_07655 [Mycobacterium sp. 852002-40037_SCH5390672]